MPHEWLPTDLLVPYLPTYLPSSIRTYLHGSICKHQKRAQPLDKKKKFNLHMKHHAPKRLLVGVPSNYLVGKGEKKEKERKKERAIYCANNRINSFLLVPLTAFSVQIKYLSCTFSVPAPCATWHGDAGPIAQVVGITACIYLFLGFPETRDGGGFVSENKYVVFVVCIHLELR